MTSISQYLRCERVDYAEPASFYVPGMEDWAELNTPVGRSRLARARSANGGDERLYPTPETEEEIENDEQK